MRTLMVLCASFVLGCGSSSSKDPSATPEPGPAMKESERAEPAPAAAEPATSGFTLEGSVKGQAPEGAEVGVVWIVSVGDDTAYNFGSGSANGASFVLTLPSSQPPEAAINDFSAAGLGRLAVGLPVLVTAGTNLAQGPLTDDSIIKKAVIGAASRHAIIWRDGSFPDGAKVTWPGGFDAQTYSCGVCEKGPRHFEIFVPVACESVEIELGPLKDLDICNWT